MIQLTPRLLAAASLVPECGCMADIGTDHAYLPLYLLQTGRIGRAVASDIHEGPAARAKEHIAREGLSEKISVRVGGGLATLAAGEADGAVIAGMGGLMIRKILEESQEIAAGMKWFVFQPQNHAVELRTWLAERGYRIERELLAKEDRMLYQILFVRHGEMKFTHPLEPETGLLALRENDPLFPEFLRDMIRKRNFTIEGVSEDSGNTVNLEKRQRALLEKEGLEALLWKYTQKT